MISFKDFAVHPDTEQALKEYVAQPTQAMLLAGPSGLGKTLIANQCASALLELDPSKVLSSPHVRIISPQDGAIKISAIRELYNFYALKVVSQAKHAVERIVIIEDIDTMTREAQNAFLKLLEEPPENTVCIMTTSRLGGILPTIRSRAQTIRVQQPENGQIVRMLEPKGYGSADIELAMRKSEGNISKAVALLEGNETDETTDYLALAKEILRDDAYTRLLKVEALSKDKTYSIDLIDALSTIASAGIQSAAKKSDEEAVERWARVLKHVLTAQEAVAKNGNLKLILSELFLTL